MEDEILKEILQKNHITGDSIQRSSGGQINATYLVDNKYAIKVERNLDVLGHQPELFTMCENAGAKIPKLVDYGTIEGKTYLVMEKLPGKKLSEIWLSLKESAKEEIAVQITEQLKIFHSIQFSKYSPQRPIEVDNFKDFIKFNANFAFDKEKLDDPVRKGVELVESFYYDNYERLADETGTAVLVHNDMHFENILCEGNKLSGIIDFDFARQAPKDYELWHLVDYLSNPSHYVEPDLRKEWSGYATGNDLRIFKKHYPELFSHENLLDRLRLYFIDDLIGVVTEGGDINRFNLGIERYYKTNWLEEHVH